MAIDKQILKFTVLHVILYFYINLQQKVKCFCFDGWPTCSNIGGLTIDTCTNYVVLGAHKFLMASW